jgi:ketosteroid isomerase-like protein
MYRTSIYFTLLLFTGCIAQSGETEREAAVNEEMINIFFQYFNRHDFIKMASLYSNDAIFLDPSFGKAFVKQSRQQTSAKYTAMAETFTDLKDDVKEICSFKDKVIVQFVSTGTAAGGKKFKLPICTVFTIKQGKIISDATYYDL